MLVETIRSGSARGQRWAGADGGARKPGRLRDRCYETASDTDATGLNGLFTAELLKVLREPEVPLREVFFRVRRGVLNERLSASSFRRCTTTCSETWCCAPAVPQLRSS